MGMTPQFETERLFTPEGRANPGLLAPSSPLPLVLDLDGTLIKTDLLFEAFAVAFRAYPLVLFMALFWIMQGRAVLKRKLAQRVAFDVMLLPIDDDLASYAAEEAAHGREVVLATAADELLARRVATRFPFISRVIASDGQTNLKGATKAARLDAEFPQGFVYAGDAPADLPIWRAAKGIIIVRASAATEQAARELGTPELVIPRPAGILKTYLKATRVKQWSKNALVLAPLALSGHLLDPAAWFQALLAFVALGLTASATYLLNDLFDLADDRQHWSKRNRPLASGRMPLAHGLMLVPVLLASGLALAASLGVPVLLSVAAYLALTLGYSFSLKRVPVLDVTTLAALFTLRLLIGVTAIAATLSPWLFVFSMSLFLSLSIAKRHTEVVRMAAHGAKKMAGRGYVAQDEPLLLGLGLTSACSAIILLTMYLTAEAFRAGFYSAPNFLWAAPLVLFLWLGRIWLLSQRGELDDDPVAFAMRDRVSLALGGVLGMAFLVASYGGHIHLPGLV